MTPIDSNYWFRLEPPRVRPGSGATLDRSILHNENVPSSLTTPSWLHHQSNMRLGLRTLQRVLLSTGRCVQPWGFLFLFSTAPLEHAETNGVCFRLLRFSHKAKTPIIAGSVSGACVLLAWTVGFIIFFMRRRRQRRRAKEAGFKSHRDIIDFVPVPDPTTFIIPPDPALVGPPASFEKHIRELERQGQLEKSPTSETHLRSPDRLERGTIPRSQEESLRSGSTTNSTPVITTITPSTVDASTVAFDSPVIESRLPLAPLIRKTPANR